MLNVIIGPPCAGKSTYVREHAKPGDVIIDFDAIATALGAEKHDARDAVKEAAFKARSAVIAYCVENAEKVDAWIIHTKPTEKQIADYEDAGADFTVIDEPLEVCLERAEADGRPQRSIDAIHEYFEKGDLMKHTKAANEAAKTDGGIVKGYAATFVREPDSYGDVIAKGAFAKSLERWAPLYEQGKRIPLLYGHNMDDPFYNIGTVTFAKEDDYGLYVEAEFDPENETAQYVRKLVQEGRLYQFSFAFSIDAEREVELDDGRKANELQELDIYEVSLVQIPANQTAVVTEVKAAEVMQGIADDIKSGRRNSAKDAKELERIGELASEIQKTVNGLLKSDDAEAADGEPKGASEGQAEIVAAYKEAILAYLKG